MQRECAGRLSDLRELGNLGHWGKCDIITWLSAFPRHWHKSKAETGRSAPSMRREGWKEVERKGQDKDQRWNKL